MELGKQIKKYRAAAKLSQEELAEKVFVSRQTVSNWENDKNYPDVKSLVLMSEVFQVSLDDLVKGDLEKMKTEIDAQEYAAFQKDSAIFAGLFIALLVAPIPLAELLGWLGLVLYIGLFAIAMYFAAHALPLVLEWFYTCFYQPYLPSVGVPIVESVVPSISPRGILYRTLLNFYGTQMAAFVLPGIAGVALTVVAMLLYRFRKLERAGSFAAVRGLSYLFLGAFSLIAAAVLFLLLGHAREQFWFLFLYVPVFYFAGAMVVEKRFHVFRAGNLFTLGILAAVLFNSLWIVKYDAFGLLTYVPKSENVRRVEVYVDVANSWGLQYDYEFFSKEGITITDPEDIEAVTQVHSQLLEKATILDARRMVYLTYTLKSGIRVRRYYPIPTGEKSYELFQELDKATSSTSALFGNVQLEDYVNQVYYIHVQSEGVGHREFYFADPSFTTDVGAGDVKIHHPAMGLQFLEHLCEDAQEGNLRQFSYVQYTVTIKNRDAWGREKTVVLTLPNLAGASTQFLELTWEAARQLPQKTITEEHNYQQLLLDAMLP